MFILHTWTDRQRDIIRHQTCDSYVHFCWLEPCRLSKTSCSSSTPHASNCTGRVLWYCFVQCAAPTHAQEPLGNAERFRIRDPIGHPYREKMQGKPIKNLRWGKACYVSQTQIPATYDLTVNIRISQILPWGNFCLVQVSRNALSYQFSAIDGQHFESLSRCYLRVFFTLL